MSAPTSHPIPENIDYSPTSNVARMHAAVAREKGEPVAKGSPIPLGIIAGIAALAIIAGSYWGANSGGDFSVANIKGYSYPLKFDGQGDVKPPEPTEAELHQPEMWLAFGKEAYGNNCASCHTASGEGQPGLYPPLKGSEFVIKGEKRLVAILQHGIIGSLTVNGKPFTGQMQPLGAPMTAKQLGQLLSYIRNAWGNSASIIYDDQITALRKELPNRSSYSEAELLAISDAENAPASEWPAKLKAATPAAGTAPAAGTTPAAGTAPAAGAPAGTPAPAEAPAPAPK